MEFKLLHDKHFGEKKTKKAFSEITDFLLEKYAENKKPVKVLDDGAGQGRFLAELKQQLTDKKIPIKTTAVSLSDKIYEKNRKYIDHFIFKDAKDLELTQKYDLITSYFGSIHYSLPAIRDQIIKKYAFALNKNGIAILRFTEYLKEPTAKNLDWIKMLEKVGFSVTAKISQPDSSSREWLLLIERLR